ncbi:MAG: diguanylate cyclase [Desulfobacterales bacterium]|nr:diguanylate cyclase [Desulfobacterales bacterium]
MTETHRNHRGLTLGYLVNEAGLAYIETDAELRTRYWNKGAEAQFGLSEDDVLGRHLNRVLDIDAQTINLLKSEEGACSVTLGCRDRQMSCRIRFTPIIGSSGIKDGIALLIRDVVKTRARESRLNAKGQSMEDILGFAPIGIFHASLAGNLIMANSEFAWMLGYESSDKAVHLVKDFIGQVFYDERKAEEFMFILMEAERITRFRCRLRRRDGSFVWTQCYAMVTRDTSGRVDGFNGYAIEIGDTIRAEKALQKANEELMRLSVIDGLTQIANRRQFDSHLSMEWRRHKKEQLPISVILCDIDFFKKYNDTYGHQVGDECLIKVARAIDDCAGEAGGLAARYGGEEFGVILPETDAKKALSVAETIRRRVLSLGVEHEASEVNSCVTLSLGVGAVIPEENDSDMGLLAQSDTALYKAKRNGRNRAFGAGFVSS